MSRHAVPILLSSGESTGPSPPRGTSLGLSAPIVMVACRASAAVPADLTLVNGGYCSRCAKNSPEGLTRVKVRYVT